MRQRNAALHTCFLFSSSERKDVPRHAFYGECFVQPCGRIDVSRWGIFDVAIKNICCVAPSTLKLLLFMSSAAGHPSVLCCVCTTMMTNHRCLQPVKTGLLMVEVIGAVCGRPVCGPCNFRHGNEGIFRCPVHSISDDDSGSSTDISLVDVKRRGRNKENRPIVSSQKRASNVEKLASKEKKSAKAVNGSDAAKATKGSEYGAKDLLILSRAFIKTSENSIDGTSQRRNKFWDDVAESFNKLKQEQEAYDTRQAKKKKMTDIILKGDFPSSDSSDEEVKVIIQKRTPSSLQQKWSKFVLPYVSKFIALTHRHPKKSGEGKLFLFVSFLFMYVLMCSTNS